MVLPWNRKPLEPPKAVDIFSVVQQLWPMITEHEFHQAHYWQFFEYVRQETAALHNELNELGSLSLLDFINDLKSITAATQRNEVFQQLRNRHTNGGMTAAAEESLWRIIEASCRIWLSLSIRIPRSTTDSAIRIFETPLLNWQLDSTLAQLVDQHFRDRKGNQLQVASRKINPALTIEYLVTRYQFRVHWTNDLANHMKVDLTDKTISIFEHKIYLWNCLRFPETSMIPVPVLREALDTFNLLFPFNNRPTKFFLEKEEKQFYSLGFCNRERVLELGEYQYWRNDIQELLGIIQEQPRGFYQLVIDKDRRNLEKVAAFWIAVTVAFLTIFSFIFGLISTIYAKKSYDMAVLQYKLSLKQACAPPQ